MVCIYRLLCRTNVTCDDEYPEFHIFKLILIFQLLLSTACNLYYNKNMDISAFYSYQNPESKSLITCTRLYLKSQQKRKKTKNYARNETCVDETTKKTNLGMHLFFYLLFSSF